MSCTTASFGDTRSPGTSKRDLAHIWQQAAVRSDPIQRHARAKKTKQRKFAEVLRIPDQVVEVTGRSRDNARRARFARTFRESSGNYTPPLLCVLAIRPTLEGAQDGA
jgi:hypothetical protein